MVGAPALAALGALRSGAGLVRLVTPEPILNHVLEICPAATGIGLPVDDEERIIAHEAAAILDDLFLAGARHCFVIGPGFGTASAQRSVVLRCVQQEEIPIVVDADGLNCLADVPELARDFHAAAVLTPHPGEYNRLARALNIDADPVTSDRRPAAAELLAQRMGCIVVLKGAGTIVSDGQRTWICSSQDSVLATGGTGDVLAGVIAGLSAQFVTLPMPGMPSPVARPLDLFDAARLGVQIHALAGQRWTERHRAAAGMSPVELADLVPEVMGEMTAP